MQARRHSLFEASANTGSAFLLSYLLGLILFPAFGFPVTAAQNFWLVSAFTVLSVVRNYLWRRLFNRLERNPRDV